MMYKFNEKVSVIAMSDLRGSEGRIRLEIGNKNTLMTQNYHIAVYENDKLIGYIDSVSNGVSDAYIQDLMVCPDYQGKGIGTDLMDKMIEYLKKKRIYMISVVYEECLKPFYEQFGFYNMLCGQMETYQKSYIIQSLAQILVWEAEHKCR